MNLVGKILTVVILIFSVVFLAISITVFQTHRNWRDMATANKTKVEELQDRVKSLQGEMEVAKDRLALEQAARRFALSTLQSKFEASEAKTLELGQQYAALQAEAGNLTQTISTNSLTLDTTIKQNDALRKDLQTAQLTRDTAFDSVVTLTDKRNELEGNARVLSERNAELNKMHTLAMHVLSRNNLSLYSPVDGKPPVVEGQILRIGEKDLLEISIGSDDGLQKGHTLEVFRNNSYLGRVVVKETSPDRSVVQIIPEYRKGIIKVGDRVATKLG